RAEPPCRTTNAGSIPCCADRNLATGGVAPDHLVRGHIVLASTRLAADDDRGARLWPGFSICRRYAAARSIEGVRVLVVEDEPYLAEAIRDGLRLEAIAADLAGDGDSALELLSVNAYDIAVLDRDIPGPSGDEIAKRIVASG